MTLRSVALLLALAGALPAWGDRDADEVYGRLRYVEPGVAVQRPDEAGAEEALVNGPLLPGDRLFSDTSGRAEVQFSDGSIVRVDRRSKLDYEDPESGRDQDLIVLTLWSGSLYLRVGEGRRHADFLIATPDGRVDVRESGIYRVDVDRGDTRLLVFEGQARLESGQRGVTVLAGERSYARRGEAPQRSEDFSPEDIDDEFARWDEQRGSVSWRADGYLPDEIEPYGADLETYGSWHNEVEVGYVWRPHVAAGWRPYSDGRWVWTAYGWTWVPYEPWGWAPFHYGRWGHSARLGWYWIPGRTWGPAWVSWRAGGDYVGWCALGRGDRPVYGPTRRDRDVAVPRRPGTHVTVATDTDGWQFARRGDLTSRDLARRRVQLAPAEAQQARTIDMSRLRLDRQTQVVEASRAVPRTVRVKPSPGDSVPELRSDPLTTIPAPVRRRLPDDRGYDTRQAGDAQTRARDRAPSPSDERETRRVPAVEDRYERSDRSRSRGGEDERPATDSARRRSSDRDRESDSRGRDAAEPARRAQPAEHEVLRRFFEPLAERRAPSSRETDRDNDSARRPRDNGRDSGREYRDGGRDSGRDSGRARDSYRDRDSGRDSGRSRDSHRDSGRDGASQRREPERSTPRAEPPRQTTPPPQERAQPRPPAKDRDQ